MDKKIIKRRIMLYSVMSILSISIIIIAIFQNIELANIYVKSKEAGYIEPMQIIESMIPTRVLLMACYIMIVVYPIKSLLSTMRKLKNTEKYTN